MGRQLPAGSSEAGLLPHGRSSMREAAHEPRAGLQRSLSRKKTVVYRPFRGYSRTGGRVRARLGRGKEAAVLPEGRACWLKRLLVVLAFVSAFALPAAAKAGPTVVRS